MTASHNSDESRATARGQDDPATEPRSDGGARSEAEFARARAQTYALLAAAFDGEVDVLRRAMAADDFARFEGLVPGEFDATALRCEDVDADALAVGYDNLFVVPGPHYVPPFASAHEDDPSEQFESDSTYHEEGEAGELFGDSAVSVSEHHARFDFSPDRGDGIPDHVAAEFEFMAALASREATLLAGEEPPDADALPDDGAEEGDLLVALRRAQRSFFDDGLDWLHAFAEAVERADDAEGVFAALARFAATFVEWDRRTMTDAIDEAVDAGTTSA